MKNVKYIYGGCLIILLISIGRIADDLLLSFLQYFSLMGASFIRTYLFLISILMLLISYWLITGSKSRSLDKNLLLRVLIGAVIGGFGSVWLMMVFLSDGL